MSDTTTAIEKSQKPGAKLAAYFKSPAVIEKFKNVLGNEANAYVQSVLIACSANPALMECDPESIFRSALRAASLELSCDPALKQAFLVPIKGKAEFWPHYRGLYNLAMRTGKYLAINVTPVRDGQRVFQHPISGLHYLALPRAGGLLVDNDHFSKLRGREYVDVTDGTGDAKIIGYLAYFRTTRGFEKTIYMTIVEIAEWASKFSPNYSNPRSLWNDPKHRPTMEMKTVLKELLRWADLSGSDNSGLRTAIAADGENEDRQWASDDDITDAVARDLPDDPPAPKSEYPIETLRALVDASSIVPDLNEAAAILALSSMPPDVSPEKAILWARVYNGELLQGDKKAAIAAADAEYLKAIKKQQDDATEQPPLTAQEPS